jgi:hypothetical protein
MINNITYLRKLVSATLIVSSLTGCSFRVNPVGPTTSYFGAYETHPNFGQRVFSGIGQGVGGVIAIPVTIVTLPITIPYYIYAANRNNNSDGHPHINYAPLIFITPAYCCIYGTSYVTGAISWPMFGWWECGYRDSDTKEYIAWSIMKSDAYVRFHDKDRNSYDIYHEGTSPGWTAGIAFITSKKYGEGLLIVPDSVEGLAYISFINGDHYETKDEAHKLGFGYSQFLKPRQPKNEIELDVTDEIWLKSRKNDSP